MPDTWALGWGSDLLLKTIAEQMGNGFTVKGLSIEHEESQIPVSLWLIDSSVEGNSIAVRV